MKCVFGFDQPFVAQFPNPPPNRPQIPKSIGKPWKARSWAPAGSAPPPPRPSRSAAARARSRGSPARASTRFRTSLSGRSPFWDAFKTKRGEKHIKKSAPTYEAIPILHFGYGQGRFHGLCKSSNNFSELLPASETFVLLTSQKEL